MNDQLREPGGKVRLYVESALERGAFVDATEGQAHYLLHVIRARPGDRVLLFNGCNGEWMAQVSTVTKRGCVLECLEHMRPQGGTPDVWLCFAPIKKIPADYLAQKATELGVRVLQPVMTQRTIVTRVNTERMSANAIEAAEQSDRLTVPQVRAPMTLKFLLGGWPTERRMLFCDETGEAPPVGEALARGAAASWAVLTGPEGGFAPAEREKIRAAPFVIPISLGPRILRADTAALAALSVFQAVRGDWR